VRNQSALRGCVWIVVVEHGNLDCLCAFATEGFQVVVDSGRICHNNFLDGWWLG